MWLVDIDDPPRLPGLLGGLARFRPGDHMDIREELARQGIEAERILMMCNPRSLGYVFNPITVYWCYSRTGGLVANVAEVHNTHGGRHSYVLMPDEHGRAEAKKEMYVSPFYPVDGNYTIRVSEPGEVVDVSVILQRPGAEKFVASMRGRRRKAGAKQLLQAWLRHPGESLRVRALIQWQGVRLWWGGLEVRPR
jgi:DUF1365 family protein